MLAINPQAYSLHHFTKPVPKVSVTENASPKEIAQTWLDKFSSIIANGEVSQLRAVFHEESWWRDHLGLSWDFHTVHGLPNIIRFLQESLPRAKLSNFKLAEHGNFVPTMTNPIPKLEWIEAMFTFESQVGSGKGMLRLVEGEDAAYRCYMFYTALQELKGVTETVGHHRPHGGNNSLGSGSTKGNWLEMRQQTVGFLTEDPDVLVIGAGQAGLNIAARLQHLGVSCLIVEKNAHIGDNWRHRYRTLVTHDPVQYTHMYGLPFPLSWPLFTPKDKLGDWFEAYANLMELNAWLSSKLHKAEYSDAEKHWTVEIAKGDGTVRTLRPKHVVFCTGHAGEPRIPAFPGQATFKGIVYHGSEHEDATTLPNVKGKKVVVVGTGNSGHDVAQNYYEAAAEVTMLQRSGTYVLQADKGLFMLHEGLYDEGGPPTSDADIYGQSLPIPVQFALNVGLTRRIAEQEKANIEGLTKAGFKLDFGHDGSGIYRKYITRGGGYYIDVGGSQLIIDGKIKVQQSPGGVNGFESDALVLADGRSLPADIVVLATGYDNMRTTLRKVMGDKVADRASDVWDLDDEGEVNAMWRPSGHPRLWFMGGSLALCRLYSRFLALQIKAIEDGLADG